MQVVNWSKEKCRWSHLPGITFVQNKRRPIVDMLIGIDQAELHCSIQEVKGKPGEPIARLTPLGWTCTGTLPAGPGDAIQANFAFFQHGEEELHSQLRRFGELGIFVLIVD